MRSPGSTKTAKPRSESLQQVRGPGSPLFLLLPRIVCESHLAVEATAAKKADGEKKRHVFMYLLAPLYTRMAMQPELFEILIQCCTTLEDLFW